ncbi:unnamed protein product [Clonostachys byssicola]|uniref:Uncharacterized protein n=1 Tax=Clonostachys byssicola TaxID=160290 RepID=A0A9N9YAH0_9HYPO|nr:unnamed protein product [Clonostachys byssicola]
MGMRRLQRLERSRDQPIPGYYELIDPGPSGLDVSRFPISWPARMQNACASSGRGPCYASIDDVHTRPTQAIAEIRIIVELWAVKHPPTLKTVLANYNPGQSHSSSKDASANATSGSVEDVTVVSSQASVGISLLQPPSLVAGAGAGAGDSSLATTAHNGPK